MDSSSSLSTVARGPGAARVVIGRHFQMWQVQDVQVGSAPLCTRFADLLGHVEHCTYKCFWRSLYLKFLMGGLFHPTMIVVVPFPPPLTG